MRFLIDAQLPPGLARHLNAVGHEGVHVAYIALSTANDRKIWDHAIASDAGLVTKDEDFVTMRALSRRGGPVIVWLRVGNTTTRALIALLNSVLPEIIGAVERGETVIQIPER